jgi:hypothetical protein
MEGQIEGFPMDDIEVEIDDFNQELQNNRRNICLLALLKFLFCLTFIINFIISIKLYIYIIDKKDLFTFIIFILSFINLYYKLNYSSLLLNEKYNSMIKRKTKIIFINILFVLALCINYEYGIGFLSLEFIVILLILLVI